MAVTTPDGTSIVVVDSQVHLNLIGDIGAGLAAMDAVGVDFVIIDEWWGYDENGIRRPNYRLSNGTVRHEYPVAVEAAMRHPDRFGYTAWVDRRDPKVAGLVSLVRENPHQSCIRLVVRPQIGEDVAFRNGEYRPLLDAAQTHGVPVMVCLTMIHLPQRAELLLPYVREFSELQFIIDHCGVLPLNQDDVAQGFARPQSLEAVLPFADFPNVAIKWSLVPMLSARPFPYDDLLPFLRRFIDVFGVQRLMWASDNTQVMPKHNWAQLLYYILMAEGLSDTEKEWLLGRTARDILRLPSNDGTFSPATPAAK